MGALRRSGTFPSSAAAGSAGFLFLSRGSTILTGRRRRCRCHCCRRRRHRPRRPRRHRSTEICWTETCLCLPICLCLGTCLFLGICLSRRTCLCLLTCFCLGTCPFPSTCPYLGTYLLPGIWRTCVWSWTLRRRRRCRRYRRHRRSNYCSCSTLTRGQPLCSLLGTY